MKGVKNALIAAGVAMVLTLLLASIPLGVWTIVIVVGIVVFLVVLWFREENQFYLFAWYCLGASGTSGALPTVRAFMTAEVQSITSFLGAVRIDGPHASVSIAFIVASLVCLILHYRDKETRSLRDLLKDVRQQGHAASSGKIDELMDRIIHRERANKEEIAKLKQQLRDKDQWRKKK